MNEREELAKRIETNPLGWLPVVGDCINITFTPEEARVLTTALRAPAQAPTDCGAWMPIETAPKVARESVLVARFGTKAIRAYQQPVGTWRMHGDWNADLSGPYAPNVWMPCPEGPALPSTDSEYDDSVSVADVKGILAPSSTDRGGK